MKTYKAFDLINPKSEFFRILRKLPHPSQEGPWIAGGSIWKAMEGIPLDCDIDFFFRNADQFKESLNLMKSMPYVHRILNEKHNRFNVSYDFHIHDHEGYDRTVKVQFISFKQWETVKALFDDFDFTACQFLFDGTHIHAGDTALDHVKERKIVFNRVKNAKLTLAHLDRYLKHGFTISDEQNALLKDLSSKKKGVVRNPVTGNMEIIPQEHGWSNYETNDNSIYARYGDDGDNYDEAPAAPTWNRPAYNTTGNITWRWGATAAATAVDTARPATPPPVTYTQMAEAPTETILTQTITEEIGREVIGRIAQAAPTPINYGEIANGAEALREQAVTENRPIIAAQQTNNNGLAPNDTVFYMDLVYNNNTDRPRPVNTNLLNEITEAQPMTTAQTLNNTLYGTYQLDGLPDMEDTGVAGESV